MTAKDLLAPRFKLIADFPNRSDFRIRVGDVLTLDYWDAKNGKYGHKQGNLTTYAPYYEQYPHLFKKMNWWEDRTEDQMPKYLVSLGFPENGVHTIVKWDMNCFFGYTDLKNRAGCDLTAFKPEYSYIPWEPCGEGDNRCNCKNPLDCGYLKINQELSKLES